MTKAHKSVLDGQLVSGPSSSTNNRVAIFDGDSGNIIKDGGKTIEELVPAENSVTNSILADVPEATVKGRAVGVGEGDPQDLTPGQLQNIFQLGSGLLYFTQQKVGVDGDGSTAGTWNVRIPNTIKLNTISGASVNTSSGIITLPAGKYIVEISDPAHTVNRHQLRLYNVTSSSVIEWGTSEYSASFASGNGPWVSRSFLFCTFELSATTTLRIDHYTQVANSLAFGVATSVGSGAGSPDIYLIGKIWKY